jgi:hypothetical protein
VGIVDKSGIDDHPAFIANFAMEGRAPPVIIAFVAGTCLGTCLALVVARYNVSTHRRRSWKEWSGWRKSGAEVPEGIPPSLQPESWPGSARQSQGEEGPGLLDSAKPQSLSEDGCWGEKQDMRQSR